MSSYLRAFKTIEIMEKYVVEGTLKSPAVNFDLSNGVLEIKGRSIPENSVEFYQPLFDALALYAANAKPTTTVKMFLPYFSTSSSKCILEIFRHLENIYKNGSAVTINWMYESDDEDMLEAGEDYQVMIKIPFTMVPVQV